MKTKLEKKEAKNKYDREWYQRNKKRKLEYKKEYLKKTNYKHERTPDQRIIRNIKRKTRYYFKIEGHNCEFCGKKATIHHHNTRPIEFDKFNFVCLDCHKIIHKKGGKK